MKLKSQVCSLELAKKLNELGVKQDSLWQWIIIHPDNKDLKDMVVLYSTILQKDLYRDEEYSAFTVAELLERLPYFVGEKKRTRTHEYLLTIQKLAIGYWVYYENGGEYLQSVTDGSLANALAEMLIYLLENKLIQ